MDIYYGAHKFELSQKLVWEQARGEATVQPEWDNLEEHCRFREQLSKVQGEEDFKGFLRVFFLSEVSKKPAEILQSRHFFYPGVSQEPTQQKGHPCGVALNMYITPYRAGLELWLRPSLQESPRASRQQQAAISNQISLQESPPWLLLHFQTPCEGLSSQWNDTGKHHCLPAYLHPLLPLFGKRNTLLNCTGVMAFAQSWGLPTNTCSQGEQIICHAPKGFRGEQETSQPRKPFIYQGSSGVLPVRFLSKQPA